MMGIAVGHLHMGEAAFWDATPHAIFAALEAVVPEDPKVKRRKAYAKWAREEMGYDWRDKGVSANG